LVLPILPSKLLEINGQVNSRRRDAKLLDELRRLEEQDKAILEETATVTTEEDDDDRLQTTDTLHDAYEFAQRDRP
jgi:hypothetical protein